MGIDIAEIPRLAKIISRYGDKFTNKIYTATELDFCARAAEARAAIYYAGRWAAKEAFYKALPPPVQPLSSWKSVQVLSDGEGRPYIDICCEKLRFALADIGVSAIHLSISHERTHCVAAVIIE